MSIVTLTVMADKQVMAALFMRVIPLTSWMTLAIDSGRVTEDRARHLSLGIAQVLINALTSKVGNGTNLDVADKSGLDGHLAEAAEKKFSGVGEYFFSLHWVWKDAGDGKGAEHR